MQICATNGDTSLVSPSVFELLQSGDTRSSHKTDRIWLGIRSQSRLLMSFEAFVGMELSMVPEVESVFVEWDKENGKAYHVFTVINARDRNARARVYEREQAIMDEFPTFDFNFRVIQRMDRDLDQVIEKVGKLAFQR